MKLFDVYPLFDIEPIRGAGSYVYDADGTAYLDFYGGHAVISIGHSHPRYVTRLTEQLSKLGFYSNSVENQLQTAFAKQLGRACCLEDYQLFLCNSGAEANENALKMASFATGKTTVIAFENSFHGRTSAAVNVTHNFSIQAPINQTFERLWLPLNDLNAAENALQRGDIAAVIIEGIQGVGGIYVPEVAFLEGLAALCQQYEVPLILDEIQSGVARSGRFFAFQFANIFPDFITIAKGIGNGFPMGGVLIAPQYQAKYGLLGTTFGGNHLACAAGLAVLETIEEEQLAANAAAVGDYLMTALRQMQGVKEVRGRGLMIGIDFDFPVKTLRQQLVKRQKVFTGSASQANTVRLLPPLNITFAEADLFLQKLEDELHDL